MTEERKPLTLENFQQTHIKNKQQRLLEEAMIYLKLRDYGCPKMRSLTFAKKKQKGIDATVKKDGPANFRKLKPVKPEGKLVNGWLKSDKLKYQGLRGFSEEIIRNTSKEKVMITTYNQKFREQFENERRDRMKQGVLQTLIEAGNTKKVLEQIGVFKDQFLKDKEKRNLFLSYEDMRLQSYTRSYFDKVEEQNAQSLIVKMGAFSGPMNDQKFKIETDWQIAKGRSLSSYQIMGQNKRKIVLQFRKSMTNLSLPQSESLKKTNKFNQILQNSNRVQLASTLNKFSKARQAEKQAKQFKQFYNDIDKIIWLKTRKSQPYNLISI